MADKNYEITVELSDGSSKKLRFTAPQGEKGSDANVTAANIEYALGYTPADAADRIEVTPQMFGAVADGETDDTDAVQAALNAGGVVYFPAGRYKVTRQLTAAKSCKIMMYKPYPCTYHGDYPLSASDNGMGARIETHAIDGYGLLLGDGVEVDGLFVRAMDDFAGVLLKFDGTFGQATYPSQIRLSHIRLDTNSIYTVPQSMFDFSPSESYFGVLDDICIGSLRGRQFCDYGFRANMATTDTNWANSMRIRNMCIDILADYSLYVEGGPKGAENWVFENLSIQSYPYVIGDSGYIGRTGHVNLITLKNMQNPLFLSGTIWDLHAGTVTGEVIAVENTKDISCFGCSSSFDAVETVLKGKLQKAADSLNISGLEMSIEGVEATGANRLTLSDGTNTQSVDIPSVSVSDEQLGAGIDKWFDDNANPVEQVGKNKFDYQSPDTVNGFYYSEPSNLDVDGMYEGNSNMTTTNFIEAKPGDSIQISKNGIPSAAYYLYHYDANKNLIKGKTKTIGDSAAAKVIDVEGTAYIRICWTGTTCKYSDLATGKMMVAVNDTNTTYEPYKIELVGGLTSYMVLQSPNGTQYRIAVGDDGELVAEPVNS